MSKVFHIVGTDTGVGKTYVSCRIIEYLIANGFIASGLKPIATGNIRTRYGFINEDVEALMDTSNYKLALSEINPVCLKEPVSPNIAAILDQFDLNVASITQQISQTLINAKCDYLLIEGIGGVMVPLNDLESYLDILMALRYPIILVVGIKLGCLNHTSLTIESLTIRNLPIIGWIANCIDPLMLRLDENIQFLKDKLTIPLLAIVNYYQNKFEPKPIWHELMLCH